MTSTDDKWIDDIVGVFFDPIIVMPGGWGDSLPEWIKGEITLERLIENMKALKGGKPAATDAEVVAYLYTASLTAPMPDPWPQIYLFTMTQLMRRSKKVELPSDIAVESLTEYQKAKLHYLRDWLYEARTRARKKTGHSQKPDEGKRMKQQLVQMSMFDSIDGA
ncbi:MAG: hypothetical protein HY670_10530 [Chloroflexi bacterium]|nr:hypothetical protein [Chloroflexota bacterium]